MQFNELGSACRQRQKTVQIHNLQDHHCLNNRHIYQTRIDLSAMLLGVILFVPS